MGCHQLSFCHSWYLLNILHPLEFIKTGLSPSHDASTFTTGTPSCCLLQAGFKSCFQRFLKCQGRADCGVQFFSGAVSHVHLEAGDAGESRTLFQSPRLGGLPTVGSLTVLDLSRLFLASMFCHQCKNLSHLTEEATNAC